MSDYTPEQLKNMGIYVYQYGYVDFLIEKEKIHDMEWLHKDLTEYISQNGTKGRQDERHNRENIESYLGNNIKKYYRSLENSLKN